MDLSYRDIVEILTIFEASGFSRLTIEDGSFRLSVARSADGAELAPPAEQLGPGQPAPSPGGQVAASPSAQPAAPRSSAAPPAGERRVSIGGLERVITAAEIQAEVSPTAVPVSAPMLGVFYRRPAPDQPPYVEVGQRVQAGDTLCLVESMKMFMPVHAPVEGLVEAIPVENGALVEFGQPIMWIEPNASV